jgi:hypothetical protein
VPGSPQIGQGRPTDSTAGEQQQASISHYSQPWSELRVEQQSRRKRTASKGSNRANRRDGSETPRPTSKSNMREERARKLALFRIGAPTKRRSLRAFVRDEFETTHRANAGRYGLSRTTTGQGAFTAVRQRLRSNFVSPGAAKFTMSSARASGCAFPT